MSLPGLFIKRKTLTQDVGRYAHFPYDEGGRLASDVVKPEQVAAHDIWVPRDKGQLIKMWILARVVSKATGATPRGVVTRILEKLGKVETWPHPTTGRLVTRVRSLAVDGDMQQPEWKDFFEQFVEIAALLVECTKPELMAEFNKALYGDRDRGR